ncbi:LLM class flavin-dependent oxidoreductase [Aliarcobacter lanthieri]|uniref:LLM class flavin-dependent oxidoreductase n=1 Tax=Aliarcobacter lanthieri TaxID=1355374 RepID=UPI003AABBE82
MYLKLSVLDQSPIHDNKEPKEGLHDSIKLAKACEEFGYYRYWCAEHHDTPGYASANPEIMVSAIASSTSKIRVGSGGVMLNHYSSYKVAETFNSLLALYGDRIDLGIGRANGANFLSARALHNQSNDSYPKKVYDLINFLEDTIPQNDYLYGIGLSPKQDSSPPVFLLGSSDGSSNLAAKFGLGFCLALFIGTHNRPVEIMNSYKRDFIPSKNFDKPKTMIAIACICANSIEEAIKIASSHIYWKVQAFRHMKRDGLYNPDDIAKLYEKLSYEDKVYFHETMETMVIGTPPQCKNKIEKLAKEYGVDEVMIVNVSYSFEDRLNSYKLLSQEFNL